MYVRIFIGNGSIKMHESELKKQINAKGAQTGGEKKWETGGGGYFWF